MPDAEFAPGVVSGLKSDGLGAPEGMSADSPLEWNEVRTLGANYGVTRDESRKQVAALAWALHH